MVKAKFSTTASSREVSTEKCDIDGKPGLYVQSGPKKWYPRFNFASMHMLSCCCVVLIQPTKPEVLKTLSPKAYIQISSNFQLQTCGFRPLRARRNCPLSTVTMNDNRKSRFWRPYCYFRLSVVFEITVFEIATVDSLRFAVEKKQI